MRKRFAELLKYEISSNSNVHLLTGDLGFGLFNSIRDDNGDQFHNMGSAEQLMVGAAIGMSVVGKIPVCYSITPFLLYRPFEFIRNYLSHENIPVKLVGSGRDRDYSHDGFTHWSEDDQEILNVFPNIIQYRPNSIEELENNFQEFLYSDSPSYLNLSRNI